MVERSSKIETKLRFQIIHLNGLRLRVATRPALVSPPTKNNNAKTLSSPLPLLILGGMGADLELLQPFVDAMDWRELILFDVPGVGKSSTPLLPMSIPQCARLVRKMLGKLGYQRVDVLGFSWGGALAQQLAYDFSDMFSQLILVSTSSGGISIPGPPTTIAKMLNPGRFMNFDYAQVLAEEIYGGSHEHNQDTLNHYLKQVQSGTNIGYYWQFMAMTGWTSIHWLHRIIQPTLIMGGKQDPIIPLANAKILEQRIPNSRLQVVDDGHLFLLTQSHMVCDLIHDFQAD